MFVKHLLDLAVFSPEKMAKSTVARGENLFAGLNCFEAGQEHTLHAHAGQDKLYVVLEGQAEIRVAGDLQVILAGGAAFAPSGVPHSVRNSGPERLVMLAVLAPPPGK